VSRFNSLRLAYRLGIAFGVVILALVVIGAISVTKLGALSNEAETMSTHDVVSMQRVLTIEHRLQTTAYLATTHLYVHDGDLSAQDRIAKQADALAAADAADLKALDTSIDPGSRALLGTYKAAVAQFATTSGTAIRRSRAETVRHDEDRAGSRDYFNSTVIPAEAAASKAGDALTRQVHGDVTRATATTAAAASSGRKTIVIAAILATLAAFGLAFLVVTSVVRPLKVVVERLGMLRDHCIAGLTDAIKAMASGDLTQTVVPQTPEIENPAGDEVGDVGRAFNDIRAKMVESIAGYDETRAQLGGLVGNVSNSAQSLSAASQQMATTSEEAGRAVGEIASAVGEVAQGAERQVRAVEQAKLATEEVATASAAGADNAQQTAEAAVSAREVAEQGAGAVAQASEAMGAVRDSSLQATEAIRELGSKSERISGIVETITGIAEQTNLLALNAAIEAARAG